MSRAVMYDEHGGPEVLDVREVPEPHAGPGEIRVHVGAAGLNAMDGMFVATPQMAAKFGISLPAGFGYDFAGTVDEVGEGATGFAVGDRVYGGAMGAAVADYVVVKTPAQTLWKTPDGIGDEVASTLPVAGRTAAAALSVVGLESDDTLLVGGAAGGVGVYAVQLAREVGATVIGTASEGTFEFVRELGALPVAYGPGLADRVRDLAGDRLTAAVDLHDIEAVEVALTLGVPAERITTIAGALEPPRGVRFTNGGSDGSPEDLDRVTEAILAGRLTVPIAASFPIERTREAVAMQLGGHVHGKIVITL